MKKQIEKIKQWLTSVVKESINEINIAEIVRTQTEKSIEKIRYDYLPHGACWFCSMPISRTNGYQMWRGKMFCQDSCFNKYKQIIQKPDENYKMFDGDPVEVFNPTDRK